LTLEGTIERCRPIVESFFLQKDGVMNEFLRVLSAGSQSPGPLDIPTLFRDTEACANQLKQYFPAIGQVFNN